MPNCETCEKRKEPLMVPYVVHEAEMARSERHIKRLWIALIVAICLMFVSNAVWVYCWMQYDYSSEEIVYQQDGEGTNIIGDRNDVDNGAESDYTEAETNP